MDAGRIIRIIVLSILLVLMAGFVTLQIPVVQKSLADKAIELAESKFDASIKLSRVHIKLFNTLVLKDLAVIDRKPVSEEARDTLFSARTISARFSLRSLISPEHQGIILKEVKLFDAQFNLVIDTSSFGNNLSRCFKLTKQQNPKGMPEKDIIAIRNIKVRNLAFSMRNFVNDHDDFPPTAINWSDLEVSQINIDARDFGISHGLFTGTVDHMDFREKTGWKVEHLSGSTITGKGKAQIYDIKLFDGVSYADLDFSMTGKSSDYPDFVNKVVMEANIRESRWGLTTLSHFIPPMTQPSDDEFFFLHGKAKGPVCNLKAEGLNLGLDGSSTSLSLFGTVANLPDVQNMQIEAYLNKLQLRFDDVGRVLKAIYKKSTLDLSALGSNGLYSGYLMAKGPLNRLHASGKLTQASSGGKITIDSDVMNVLKKGIVPITAKGRVEAAGLNLNSLLETDILGPVAATAYFHASVTPGQTSGFIAGVDSLQIQSADVRGYTYRNIWGSAELKGKDLSAILYSRDPNLNADVKVSTIREDYIADVKISRADLSAMHFDSRETGVVKLTASAKLDKDLSKPKGSARLSNIFLINESGSHHVPDLEITAGNIDGRQNYSLNSKLANANFTDRNGNMAADLGVVDTRELLAYLLPGLYFEKGTCADIQMDSTGFINGHLRSGRVAYMGNYIKDVEAKVSGYRDSLCLDLTGSRIVALDYTMDNAKADATLIGKRINARYRFHNDNPNLKEDQLMDGSLESIITLNSPGLEIDVFPSYLKTTMNDWQIKESSISIHGRELKVNAFELKSRDQYLFVDGETSDSQETELKAELKNFDISILNTILKRQELGLEGRVTANARLVSPIGAGHLPGLEMTLDADSLELADVPFGKMQARSILDKESDKFKVTVNDSIDGRDAIRMNVEYSPENKDMDISASLDKFPIGGFRGLLSSVFSQMSGDISGDFFAKGRAKELDLSSRNGKIENGLLEVAFTHVPYFLEGSFNIDNDGVHIDEMQVKDRFGSQGRAIGGLDWDRFKNMELDLGFNLSNMEAINIPGTSDPLLSGNIFASGKAALSGPFSGIVLSANCRTEPKSKLHISLSSTEVSAKKHLLNFVDPYEVKIEDPYLALYKKLSGKSNESSSNFSLNIKALADPTLLVSLDLGNMGFAAGMSGRGSGSISLLMDPSSEEGFQMFGDYTLSEGKFNVNAANIVQRSFNIKNGSTIKFTGDVMKSEVDIDATYQTKASIATLISDTTAVASRRQVNCGINVQNTLSAPDVKFSIDIPDLEPTVKSSVESALSTEDKVQKQFLSLLLSNNFLPDEQSGVVNNTSLLYANVSEMMAGQINSIFSKLDIPLDLGLNYQPTERGANIFDVALSTQLFNNRVIIGGSLGNRQSTTSSNGTLVGDLDVEVKIDRTGTFRLNLFSHSADQYTRYLDNSQRNGIGLTWQQDFDNFAQWCRNLFISKQKRLKLSEEELKKNRNRKILILDE